MKLPLLPPPNDYFAGDLHLGHSLMIRPVDEGGEGRPFATLEEMTETFVRNLGAGGSQKSNDVLWLTGDVCWHKPLLTPFMEAIRPHWGRINLIIGNHDYSHTRKKVDLFDEIHDEIHDGIVLERLGKCIHVTHYPMESWCKSNYGSIHLHAHSHGSSRTIPRRLDTGIMKQNWQAIQLQALLTIIDHRDSTIQSQNSNPAPAWGMGNLRNTEIMNSKIEALRLSNPDIALTIHWEHDPYFQWDGDGPDPENYGYLPHGVEVRASKIFAGELITGSAYLGGCYAIPGDFDAEIDGFLDQMIDESLENLAAR